MTYVFMYAGFKQLTFFTDSEHLSYIKSTNNDYKEDRTWEFTCASSGTTLSNCEWSGYKNGYDGGLDYKCENGVINGRFLFNNWSPKAR